MSLETLIDEYKGIQKTLDKLFASYIREFCPSCDKCCHKLPSGIEDDIKILELDGSLPDVDMDVVGICPFKDKDGSCMVKGLKPYRCIRHTCDNLTNGLLKKGKWEEVFILLRNMKDIYDEIVRQINGVQ